MTALIVPTVLWSAAFGIWLLRPAPRNDYPARVAGACVAGMTAGVLFAAWHQAVTV